MPLYNPPAGGPGGADWGDIGGTLSNQTDLQTELDDKQDLLVSATNIKTVNGTTLLGSGDLVVSATVAAPFTGDQGAGDFTIATEQFGIQGRRLTLASTERGTIEGTGRLVICG